MILDLQIRSLGFSYSNSQMQLKKLILWKFVHLIETLSRINRSLKIKVVQFCCNGSSQGESLENYFHLDVAFSDWDMPWEAQLARAGYHGFRLSGILFSPIPHFHFNIVSVIILFPTHGILICPG